MKFICYSIVLLTIFELSWSEPSEDDKKATKFEKDVEKLLKDIEKDRQNELDWLKNNILARADDIVGAFSNAKVTIGNQLELFGDKGKALNVDFQEEIDILISSNSVLKNKLSLEAVLNVIAHLFDINRSNLQDDIETIKTLINKKNKAIKCWNDSDDLIKRLFDDLFDTIHFNSQQRANQLKIEVNVVLNEIEATTERIANELQGRSPASAINYVSKR